MCTHFNGGVVLLDRFGEQRARARVQTACVAHGRPAIRCFNVVNIGNLGRDSRSPGVDDGHQRLADGDRPAVGAPVDTERVAVLDDQHGHHRLAVAFEDVDVEFDERLAGAHCLAFGHARRETLALQEHGIDADMQQHAHTVRGFEHAGVMRSMQLRDHAVARRIKDTRTRVDGQTIAEHASSEHRIGHRLDRNDDTTCKSRQFQLRKTHQSLQKPRLKRRTRRNT